MNKDKNFKKENTTKYGEFIPTYFEWKSPEAQKKRADELNNMTKKSNKN